MFKLTNALAAALIAGAALTNTANSAAQAGGFRVGFGMPLGAFVAHSLLSEAQRQNQRGYRHSRPAYDKPVHAKKAPKQSVAQSRPAKPRIEKVAKADKKPARVVAAATNRVHKPVTTAALQSKTVDTPPAAAATVATVATETPVTAPATTELVELKAIDATPITTVTAVEAAPTAVTTTDDASAEKTVNISTTVKAVCRRYSPAIAAIVEVPCE